MQNKRTHRWILTGIVGLGSFVFTVAPLHAADRDTAARDGRDRNGDSINSRDARDNTDSRRADRSVDRNDQDVVDVTTYDRLPDKVKNRVDDLRKNDKISAVYRMRHNGQDMYRVTVQHKNSFRVLLLASTGQELNIEDVRPSELSSYRQDPDKWYRDYDDRMLSQQRSYTQDAERVTATVDHPEKIALDRVPAAVRASMIREAGGDTQKLNYIIRYRDTSGNVLYQTSIPDSNNTAHMVQILPDGRMFNEGEFSNNGKRVDDAQPRTLGYNDLPNRVRDTIDREAPSGRVPHVDVASRRGQNIYTVQINESDRTRYLTVNEDGKVLSDVSDRVDNSRDRTRG